MRIATGLVLLALLAGCSAGGSPEGEAVPENTTAGPATGIAARAGIALRYDYRFQLPAAGIAAAQERHAAACEQLGPQRCRITGLHYLVDGPSGINATLDVALAPTVARAFGRAAVTNVTAAKGRLVETRIGTEDAGTAAADAGNRRTDATARLREIDAYLSDPKIRAAERAVLVREAATLREAIQADTAGIATAATALAATPLHIAYEAGDLVRGFDRAAPLRDAFGSAIDRSVEALALLVTLIATLLPWLLAGMLGLFVWRRYLQRWLAPRDRPDARSDPL